MLVRYDQCSPDRLVDSLVFIAPQAKGAGMPVGPATKCKSRATLPTTSKFKHRLREGVQLEMPVLIGQIYPTA